MTDLRKLAAKKIRVAEKQAGLSDGGLYRVPHGERGYRWYRVSLRFYPSQKWMVEEMDGGPIGSQPIPGTYRALDDALKASLESWL